MNDRESMKNLRIEIYKPGQKEPEKTVSVPLSSLDISLKLMPQKIKASLEAEGVDLTVCSDLTKEKDLRGALIEIERRGETLVISVEGNNR
jgi:hypothetical protein